MGGFPILIALVLLGQAEDVAPIVRSAQSGLWSAPASWEAGKVPGRGARVLVRPGHRIVYDLQSEEPIRAINLAGTLSFSPDMDTSLTVGLIRIEANERYSEDGAECEAHRMEPGENVARPALELGTPTRPISAKHTAKIRLLYQEGMNKDSCPAIVCCGGRMDFHGSPMSHTWVRLGASAKKGDANLTLAEPVTGWRVGDRIIITSTENPDYGHGEQTEERTIQAIQNQTIMLDQPVKADHRGEGEFRGEVANLSRNVVIESADPTGLRGHTMYHRHSAGSISYAEFRHLGKKDVLGRYSLHYHLVGDTMRGSSVVGASIWDSQNRWLTIHGTNYLVVRDCVGYRSVGHGYFFEDGTEVFNVLDRNLAVQAQRGKRLPKQVLPFDANEGAGFWWANSLNTFTRNVSCDNARYGFRYEATQTSALKLNFSVMQPDGSHKNVDIRTLPFVRFDDNESHSEGLYGINIGEGVNRVGPDAKHPFILRNTKIWAIHYAFRPQAPSILVENLNIWKSVYGVYHPNYDQHVYRNITINGDGEEPFNRGHDDTSTQYGKVTVDGLTFTGVRGSPNSIPLIQMTDDNMTGQAEAHIRNLKVSRLQSNDRRSVLNVGGGARVTPKTPQGVPIYLHDYFGPGMSAKVAMLNAKDFGNDGLTYREEKQLTGPEARLAEVKGMSFPNLLDPEDDLPPTTVITHILQEGDHVVIRGTTSDNGIVKRVLVNGREARSVRDHFAEWELQLPTMPNSIRAHAEDDAGNVEPRAHVVVVRNE